MNHLCNKSSRQPLHEITAKNHPETAIFSSFGKKIQSLLAQCRPTERYCRKTEGDAFALAWDYTRCAETLL